MIQRCLFSNFSYQSINQKVCYSAIIDKILLNRPINKILNPYNLMDPQIDSKNKKQQDSQYYDQQQDTNNQKQSVQVSPCLEDYRKFMKNVTTLVHDPHEFRESLKKNKIVYCADKFCDQVLISIIYQTACFQAVVLSITFSYFTFKITVLNLECSSLSRKHLKMVSKGSEGNLFVGHQQNKSYFAIKNIKYFTHKLMQNSLKQEKIKKVIVEYCFYKLCSSLKIGPCLSSIFGFDLIIYSDEIQFAMELCVDRKNIDIESLAVSLKLLHSFKIIHGDIKNRNIMWSPTYEKYVFIDFGYSRFLRQSIGQMTKTSYFGTLAFSSPQMQALFDNQSQGFIDLYFNDVYALLKVKQNQKQLQFLNFQLGQYQIDNEYRNFLFNNCLQYIIFTSENEQILEQLIKTNRLQNISNLTVEFIKESQSSKTLVRILQLLVKNCNIDDKLLLNHRLKNKFEVNMPKKERLNQRVKEIISENDDYFNELADYLEFFYGQDIRPRQLIAKSKILQQMKLYQFNNKQFWRCFLEYVENIYTSETEVLGIFEQVKKILEIQQWKSIVNKNFTFSLRAQQIKQAVALKFNINLLNLNSEIRAQKTEKCFQTIKNRDIIKREPYKIICKYWKNIKSHTFPTDLINPFSPYRSQVKQIMDHLLKIPNKQMNIQTEVFLQQIIKQKQIYYKPAQYILNAIRNSMPLLKSGLGLRYFQFEQFPKQLIGLMVFDKVGFECKFFYNYCFYPNIYLTNFTTIQMTLFDINPSAVKGGCLIIIPVLNKLVKQIKQLSIPVIGILQQTFDHVLTTIHFQQLKYLRPIQQFNPVIKIIFQHFKELCHKKNGQNIFGMWKKYLYGQGLAHVLYSLGYNVPIPTQQFRHKIKTFAKMQAKIKQKVFDHQISQHLYHAQLKSIIQRKIKLVDNFLKVSDTSTEIQQQNLRSAALRLQIVLSYKQLIELDLSSLYRRILTNFFQQKFLKYVTYRNYIDIKLSIFIYQYSRTGNLQNTLKIIIVNLPYDKNKLLYRQANEFIYCFLDLFQRHPIGYSLWHIACSINSIFRLKQNFINLNVTETMLICVFIIKQLTNRLSIDSEDHINIAKLATYKVLSKFIYKIERSAYYSNLVLYLIKFSADSLKLTNQQINTKYRIKKMRKLRYFRNKEIAIPVKKIQVVINKISKNYSIKNFDYIFQIVSKIEQKLKCIYDNKLTPQFYNLLNQPAEGPARYILKLYTDSKKQPIN